MATVYLGLGSNLGECENNLALAREKLQKEIHLTACSSILRTKPLYVTEQPDFYNQVIQGETLLSPQELLSFIKDLEKELGRIPTFLYGPRLIDIDILYYDTLIFQAPFLHIPHLKNQERPFIVSLMLELQPDFICPLTKKPIEEI